MNQMLSFRAGLWCILAIALIPGPVRPADYLIWKNLSKFSAIRMGVGVTSLGGKIYVIGGYGMAGTSQEAGILNTTTGAITGINPIPQVREAPAVVSYGGTVFVVGGLDNSGAGVGQGNTSDLGPPDTVWHNNITPLMNTGRGYMGAACIGSTVYVFGGISANPFTPGTCLNTMESYDLSAGGAGAWAPHATKIMSEAKAGMLTVVLNGKIYIIGGAITGFPGASSKVEIYDPIPGGLDGFSAGPDMPVGIAYATGGVINGKIFVLPQSVTVGQATPFYVFDPATNRWDTVSYKYDSPYASTSRRATVVVGQKIYVIGGTTPISSIDEITDIDFSVNAPKDGKIQIRNNIINIDSKGQKAYIVVKGTAGKGYSLAVYSRAGLKLGVIVESAVIGADGTALTVFDGTLASGKKLGSGAYWVVGGMSVSDRQLMMVINGK